MGSPSLSIEALMRKGLQEVKASGVDVLSKVANTINPKVEYAVQLNEGLKGLIPTPLKPEPFNALQETQALSQETWAGIAKALVDVVVPIGAADIALSVVPFVRGGRAAIKALDAVKSIKVMDEAFAPVLSKAVGEYLAKGKLRAIEADDVVSDAWLALARQGKDKEFTPVDILDTIEGVVSSKRKGLATDMRTTTGLGKVEDSLSTTPDYAKQVTVGKELPPEARELVEAVKQVEHKATNAQIAKVLNENKVVNPMDVAFGQWALDNAGGLDLGDVNDVKLRPLVLKWLASNPPTPRTVSKRNLTAHLKGAFTGKLPNTYTDFSKAIGSFGQREVARSINATTKDDRLRTVLRRFVAPIGKPVEPPALLEKLKWTDIGEGDVKEGLMGVLKHLREKRVRAGRLPQRTGGPLKR